MFTGWSGTLQVTTTPTLVMTAPHGVATAQNVADYADCD